LPLGGRPDPDFGHKGKIFLALAVAAIAFLRTTPQTETVKFLPAMGTCDYETLRPHLHWSASAVAVDNLRSPPILFVSRIASVVEIPASVGAEPIAPIHHARAAHKALGDVGAIGLSSVTVGEKRFGQSCRVSNHQILQQKHSSAKMKPEHRNSGEWGRNPVLGQIGRAAKAWDETFALLSEWWRVRAGAWQHAPAQATTVNRHAAFVADFESATRGQPGTLRRLFGMARSLMPLSLL
jgi:hypothetical protein